jgi:hypothetical protein
LQFKASSGNDQSKMDWRYGSSGRASALQVQSPEFTLESHPKKPTKTKQKPTGLEMWLKVAVLALQVQGPKFKPQ